MFCFGLQLVFTRGVYKMLAVPLARLLCALAGNNGPGNQLQHLLEHQMEPPQWSPSAEGSHVSLERIGGVESCGSWCLNAKDRKPGLEVPPFLLSPQSTHSHCVQFAWLVLKARTSGPRSFYTTDATSLEMRFIQLDSEGKWPFLL